MRVGVIGSGLFGITLVSGILSDDWRTQLLWISKDPEPGGLWNRNSTCSRVYDGLTLLTTQHCSTIDGYPLPGRLGRLQYLTASLYESYLREVGLRLAGRCEAHFKTEVLAAQQDTQGKIDLKVQDASGTKQIEALDAVIAAVGRYGTPYVPAIFDQSPNTIHSCDFKSAKLIPGDRVLVVGAGPSATDIASLLASRGKRVTMSMRSVPTFTHKRLAGIPLAACSRRNPRAQPSPPSETSHRLLRVIGPRQQRYGVPGPTAGGVGVPVMHDRFLKQVKAGAITVVPELRSHDGYRAETVSGLDVSMEYTILATGYANHAEIEGSQGIQGGGWLKANVHRCYGSSALCAQAQTEEVLQKLREKMTKDWSPR